MAKPTPTNPIASSNQALDSQTLRECEAMLNYALANGKKIKPEILAKLTKVKNTMAQSEASGAPQRSTKVDEIGQVHNMLADIIAPATPATVVLMEDTQQRGWQFLGPVPLVRKMMIVTLLCLMVFLGLFAFDEVDGRSINGDILSYPLHSFLLNELFIVSAAALGAAFYALFEAYKYIATSSYDTKYDSIYWIRFILGVVSGVILAQFIFIDNSVASNSAITDAVGTGAADPNAVGSFITYKPLLAFLGGFSARVVHKILNSLVDSVETFISGSARDAIRAREEAAKVQIQDKINSIQQETNRKEAATRLDSVVKLMQLQEKLTQGTSNAELQTELKTLINQMIQPVSGQPLYGGDNNANVSTNPANNPNFATPTDMNIPASDEIIVPDPTDMDIPDTFPGDMDDVPPTSDFKP